MGNLEDEKCYSIGICRGGSWISIKVKGKRSTGGMGLRKIEALINVWAFCDALQI